MAKYSSQTYNINCLHHSRQYFDILFNKEIITIIKGLNDMVNEELHDSILDHFIYVPSNEYLDICADLIQGARTLQQCLNCCIGIHCQFHKFYFTPYYTFQVMLNKIDTNPHYVNARYFNETFVAYSYQCIRALKVSHILLLSNVSKTNILVIYVVRMFCTS